MNANSKGNGNTYGGFQQLTTRYSRGNDNGYHGGIIIYHQNTQKPAITSLTEWKTYLESDPDKIGIKCNDIPFRKLFSIANIIIEILDILIM